jgi:hypothetical protein
MSNSKGWLELGAPWRLNETTMNLFGSGKTKGKDFRLPGAAHCGKEIICRS